MLSTLAPSNEHYIALANIGIVVLQEEDLVDSVILKSRELDEYAYRTSQTSLKDQILLPTYLRNRWSAGAW